MYRLAYRNFGTHESIVVNHSVDAGGGKTAVRWYELRSPRTTPVVFQQGTFAPGTTSRWMGSIAMDKSGDIALGYSASSSTMAPSIFITGRVPSDALNTFETETRIITGAGSQQDIERWGDYSTMSIDPADDCTFWYTQEYLRFNGSFNWYTRIANFKFPTCGTNVPGASVSPPSLAFGNQNIGTTSASKVVTLTNTGLTTLTISSIAISGGNSGAFLIQSKTCGTTLVSGANCTVSVAFRPTAAGTEASTLVFTDNASPTTQNVALSGTGLNLQITPTSLTFGSQTVGNVSAAQAVTITNRGTTALTFTSFTITGDAVLPGKTCGASLAAGASCRLSIAFEPTASGARTAHVTLTDSATASPQTITITGTGL
jgi:Cep192 domain 4/HYDIN/CFA65/VesB-like, Ig-like domain